jgi:hypothetical protein
VVRERRAPGKRLNLMEGHSSDSCVPAGERLAWGVWCAERLAEGPARRDAYERIADRDRRGVDGGAG